MKVLAIDAATSTGWATNGGGGVESGIQKFELRRGSSPGRRFLDFRIWLQELVAALQPELVAYEMSHFRGGSATELGVGFTTRVMEVAAAHHLEYAGIHTATLKRFATGDSHADKDAMKAVARERFPHYRPETDPGGDEADALLILAWVQEGMPEPARPPRKKRAKKKDG